MNELTATTAIAFVSAEQLDLVIIAGTTTPFLGERASGFDVMKLRRVRGVKSPESVKHGNVTIDAAILFNCVQDVGGSEKASSLFIVLVLSLFLRNAATDHLLLFMFRHLVRLRQKSS